MSQNETNSEQSQPPVQPQSNSSSTMLELLQAIELIKKINQQGRLTPIVQMWRNFLLTTVMAVVLVLLGITSTVIWMLENDSWKNYVPLGCKLDPSLYSKVYIPEYPPAYDNMSIEDELRFWKDRDLQHIVFEQNLILRLDAIRERCEGIAGKVEGIESGAEG